MPKPNAPCPCGSSSKCERCCDDSRRDRRGLRAAAGGAAGAAQQQLNRPPQRPTTPTNNAACAAGPSNDAHAGVAQAHGAHEAQTQQAAAGASSDARTGTITQNTHQARTRQAALAGERRAQFSLGLALEQAGDTAGAIEWLSRAAEQGMAEAAYNLGVIYREGGSAADGPGVDHAAAYRWFRHAAEQGIGNAGYLLGCYCAHGAEGVAQDAEAAAWWWGKAAAEGHAHAQYNVATCYRDGVGVGKDLTTAAAWYTRAADQGVAAAQTALGTLYRLGQGVEVDTHLAVMLNARAASQGDATAMYNLSVMHGVLDFDERLEWARKAVEAAESAGETGATALLFDANLSQLQGDADASAKGAAASKALKKALKKATTDEAVALESGLQALRRRRQCDGCGASPSENPEIVLRRCKGCDVEWYCDVICQAQRWGAHKAVCERAKRRASKEGGKD